MDPVFKKMNFKDETKILVLNHPPSFQENIDGMTGYTSFVHQPSKIKKIEFVIAFVTEQKQIDSIVKKIAHKFDGDAKIWFSYPKKSSKNYTCNFNRDTGWQIMGEYDLEGVRQVAIDADWSAIRFRKLDYIKTLTRRKSMALSKKAKEKTTGK